MKKAIGFLGGQYGDAFITLGLQKAFTEDHPGCEFTFALSRKYSAVLPLFKAEPHISRLHVWEGYDNEWPTEADQRFIEEEKFDRVFHPMQRQDPNFFLKCHQVTSVCRMYDYRDPTTNKISLTPPDIFAGSMDKLVGISVFPDNGNGIKSLSLERAGFIASYLKSRGMSPVQFGGPSEPRIPNAVFIDQPYAGAAAILCQCRFLVTGDTGFSWLASAYDIPVVGLYAKGYYPSAPNCKNWQPINNEAIYLEGWSANDIELENICREIDKKIYETRPRTYFT